MSLHAGLKHRHLHSRCLDHIEAIRKGVPELGHTGQGQTNINMAAICFNEPPFFFYRYLFANIDFVGQYVHEQLSTI